MPPQPGRAGQKRRQSCNADQVFHGRHPISIAQGAEGRFAVTAGDLHALRTIHAGAGAIGGRLAARHDAIIAAAGTLAAEAGINAVQIGPVSQRAGVATGTVYRYFPSKTELVAALVASVSERELSAMRRAASLACPPTSTTST